jgi:hypothetical protein
MAGFFTQEESQGQGGRLERGPAAGGLIMDASEIDRLKTENGGWTRKSLAEGVARRG